jgi:FtsZ-binding cell division protein ZapB
MEQTDMTMTRTQYEHTCAVKAGIIHALRDNLGDEFSAKEIAASMAWPSDLEPMQVGAILKSMVAEGLVTRRRQHDGNLYQLHKRALAWTPPEYDWRVARSNPVAKTKPPATGKINGAPVQLPPDKTPTRKQPKSPAGKPAAKRAGPPIANLDASSQRKPADSHPWVHPPAVTKDKPDRGAITRPLPVHLETPAELSLEAMRRVGYCPEAPIDPATGTGALLVVDPTLGAASSQPTVDDSSPSEIPNSSETNDPEIPDSSPAAVVAHEAPIDAQQTLPAESHEDEPPAHRGCGGHCANHARASDDQELRQVFDRAMVEMRDLTNDLAISQRDLEGALAKINALAVELEALEDRNACLADDLAISQQERDRLHEQVRAYARQHTEDQNRIDALMDVARPHLAKGKHGDTARAAAPFGLPVIPKDWIGLLKLTLLDDNAKLVLKIENEGGGAYATLKVDAALNQGEADFTHGLTNGLIGLLYYLLPHLAISPPDHFADTGNMVGSEARP